MHINSIKAFDDYFSLSSVVCFVNKKHLDTSQATVDFSIEKKMSKIILNDNLPISVLSSNEIIT